MPKFYHNYEGKGRKLYFDLNHVNTFEYHHLGPDIGAREARRAKASLMGIIKQSIINSNPDSPVYTFLPKLIKPRLSDEDYEDLLEETEETHEWIASHLRDGEESIKNSKFLDAVNAFSQLREIKPDDPYIIQRLAFSTYKSKHPSILESLITAKEIISLLDPEKSNDPETLGINGAIRKRLWEESNDIVQLNAAIASYSRGFEVRRDYYNGENLALCLNMRSKQQEDDKEALYDKMSAHKVRQSVYEILSEIITSDNFSERSDQKWILATQSIISLGLGLNEESRKYEIDFFSKIESDWERETFTHSKNTLIGLLNS